MALAAGAEDPIRLLREATGKLLELGAKNTDRALAVAVPYMMLCGLVLGGWLMARAARVVRADAALAGQAFGAAKQATARAYMELLLPRALGLAQIVKGADGVAGVDAALI